MNCAWVKRAQERLTEGTKVNSNKIEVSLRTKGGTTYSNRLRAEGMLPGVVYSGGNDATPVSLKAKDLVMTLRGKRATQVFELKSDSEKVDGTLVFVKDIQKEPIKDKLLHVDFLSISKDKPVVIEIPVDVIGKPEVVKHGAAVLEQRAYYVEVECLPADVPTVFQVDATGLDIGESIHVSAIDISDKVTLRTNPEQTLVTVASTRAAALEVESMDADAADEASTEAGTEKGATPEGGAEGEESEKTEGDSGAQKSDSGKKGE